MSNLGEEKRELEVLPIGWPMKREQPQQQPEPEREPVYVPEKKEED